jgi:hypothetical protein
MVDTLLALGLTDDRAVVEAALREARFDANRASDILLSGLAPPEKPKPKPKRPVEIQPRLSDEIRQRRMEAKPRVSDEVRQRLMAAKPGMMPWAEVETMYLEVCAGDLATALALLADLKRG